MEPGLILAIAIAAVLLLAARLWAARRATNGDIRFHWLILLPRLFAGVVMIWAGASMARFDLAAGLVFVAIGVVTLVLLVRAMRAVSQRSVTEANSGDITGPMLDSLVWGVLIVPLLLGAMLVIMAITGRLNR